MVECTFGILVSKWRILNRPLHTNFDFSDSIVKTCYILHNYVRKQIGFCFEDALYKCNLDDVDIIGTRGTNTEIQIKDYFANYFTSPQGCVPWQYNKI